MDTGPGNPNIVGLFAGTIPATRLAGYAGFPWT